MTAVRALVLGNKAHGDKGRRVQLLTEDQGCETVFLSSAAQQRKLQGILVLGNLVRCERKKSRGKTRITPVGVDRMVERATSDLDVFHHLSYVLEIARSLTRDVALESASFKLVVSYLERLESAGANDYLLLTWQLAFFDSIGMRLTPYPCVLTNDLPNGFSLEHGGAVRMQACPTAYRVSSQALWSLNQAWQNMYEDARPQDVDELHRLFARIWAEFLGVGLKSAMFLESSVRSVRL